jgi:hypothetical protein
VSDSNGKQNTTSEGINFTLGLLAIVLAIINIIYGVLVIWHLHYGVMYIFIEAILLLVTFFIMLNKINYKFLLFIPIVVGIITIIIGIRYDHFTEVAVNSKIIMGGLLLIIASCMLVITSNYKYFIFVSFIFVIINVIIELFNLIDNGIWRYYYPHEATFSGILITVQIILSIIFFTMIKRKENYKFMIFVPIIFGIINIFIGGTHILKEILIRILNSYISFNTYNVITFGILVFCGILLIILSLEIIGKLNYNIILSIPIPFGIMNIIYALDKILNYWLFFDDYIFVAVVILEGFLFIIISCISISRMNHD